MKFKKGLAQIDGKWKKVKYPFERKLRLVKRDLKLIEDNVEQLIVEEYTLLSQKKGKKVDYSDHFVIYYPKAVYRFKQYIIGGPNDK